MHMPIRVSLFGETSRLQKNKFCFYLLIHLRLIFPPLIQIVLASARGCNQIAAVNSNASLSFKQR